MTAPNRKWEKLPLTTIARQSKGNKFTSSPIDGKDDADGKFDKKPTEPATVKEEPTRKQPNMKEATAIPKPIDEEDKRQPTTTPTNPFH